MKVERIDDIEYVRYNDIRDRPAEPVDGMRYCIIRCRDAGIHSGFVKNHPEGTREVTLVKSRRLWKWYGKTLSGLAVDGSFQPESCKFSDEVEEITLLDACEIIPCTPKSVNSLRNKVGPWNND